ncbi:MAG: hypothetical protein JWM11_2166 [Planctomycetaceae bacterium]|nr:hypothetical protein [Planctomycetaceae bacterium]
MGRSFCRRRQIEHVRCVERHIGQTSNCQALKPLVLAGWLLAKVTSLISQDALVPGSDQNGGKPIESDTGFCDTKLLRQDANQYQSRFGFAISTRRSVNFRTLTASVVAAVFHSRDPDKHPE